MDKCRESTFSLSTNKEPKDLTETTYGKHYINRYIRSSGKIILMLPRTNISHKLQQSIIESDVLIHYRWERTIRSQEKDEWHRTKKTEFHIQINRSTTISDIYRWACVVKVHAHRTRNCQQNWSIWLGLPVLVYVAMSNLMHVFGS